MSCSDSMMVNRASDPHGLDKRCDPKFCVGFQVQQETPEEGWRTYWSKHCEYNNKNEDNSPKTLNDKNREASSQKFKQLLIHIIKYSNINLDKYFSMK